MEMVEGRSARKRKSSLKVTSAAVDSATKVLEQEKAKQDEIQRLMTENQSLMLKIQHLDSAADSQELQLLKEKLSSSEHRIEQLKQSLSQAQSDERFRVWLPVSKRFTTCRLTLLEPNQLHIPSYNRRDQSLLSLDNQSVRSLYEEIKVQQKEPVLVRRVEGAEHPLELVYGSRRCFCLREIVKNFDPSRKIKAWLGEDIPIEDAKILSVKENEDREDISPWEQAQFILRLQHNHPDWSQQQLAQEVGLTQASISKYLSLQAIPVDLVRLLETPMLLTVNGGKKIVKALEQFDQVSKQQMFEELSGNCFDSTVKLLRRINAFQAPKQSADLKRSKKLITNKAGKVRAKLGEVRGKPGQYKVDLFDLKASELASLQDFLERLFIKKG